MNKKCVLIGYLGHGKTTLFNKICGQTQQADDDLESNTLQITESKSKSGFILVDTPGLGAINDIFKHTTTIIAALTDGPINCILLVVKCEYRKDIIQGKIQEIIPLVQNYIELVTVIITHFDLVKKQDEYEQEIRNMILNKFKINSVLFSGSHTKGEALCLDIENQLQKQPKILRFTDNQIDDLMMKLEFNAQLSKGKEDFQTKFNKFYITVKKFLKGFQQNIEDQDQILHSLHIFVRKQAQIIQENFEKQYGPIMEQLHQQHNDPVEAYYFHTVLKYSINNQVQELIELINNKMIYPENHPYRCLRKCPHCGIIWLKVIGCDDITCGNRVKEQDEIEIKKQNQLKEKYYEFTISQGNLVFKEECQYYPRKQMNQEKKSNDPLDQIIWYLGQMNIQKKVESTVKALGCGKRFHWNEALILNINELKLQHEEIYRYLSSKDQFYKKEYEIVRNELILEVLRKKVIL